MNLKSFITFYIGEGEIILLGRVSPCLNSFFIRRTDKNEMEYGCKADYCKCKNLIKDGTKRYVIVGDNNFWYATLANGDDKSLKDVIKEIVSREFEYDDASLPKLTRLYVYEYSSVENIPVLEITDNLDTTELY